MNMIRHDNPGPHLVFPPVAFEQDSLGYFRHLLAAEPTLAMTSVLKLEAAGQFD